MYAISYEFSIISFLNLFTNLILNGDNLYHCKRGELNQGSAYIFYRSGSTWTQQAKLITSDGNANDYFGWSVSISDDYIIAGAPYDDIDIYTNQGSAYLFHKTGMDWIQEAKITASDGKSEDNFGLSTSISGDYAIIGSWRRY